MCYIISMIKLLFLHFVADFIFQSREMGKRKSIEFKWLLYHLTIQFLVFLPFTNWKFALFNIIAHGIIDWNIWGLYKTFVHCRIQRNPQHILLSDDTESGTLGWNFWEDHWFFVTIGLDQFLHISTIVYLSSKFL